jgi:hypothetical protein
LFRFVFVDFVSFRFVSFLFRFALYRYPFLFRYDFIDFVLLPLVSFLFRFHFVDFVSFRFVSFLLISFRFVSFSLISFRFYFVSHFIQMLKSVWKINCVLFYVKTKPLKIKWTVNFKELVKVTVLIANVYLSTCGSLSSVR